jgi:predicted RND superfamily exporter protein
MMLRLLAWPARHPRAALLISMIMALLSVLAVSRVRPNASLESMMSSGDPAVKKLVRVLHEFPVAEELLLMATLPEQSANGGGAGDPQKLLEFAARFEGDVRRSPDAAPLCGAITYRAPPQIREFVEKVIVPNGLFYLDDEAFAAARKRLTREQMVEQLRRQEARLSVPGPGAAAISKVFAKDPLSLHEFMMERMTGGASPFKLQPNSDAFISADGRSILIRIAGTRPPSDLENAKRITAAVTEAANRINTDGLELNISGSYAIAAASAKAIRADMIESVASSIAFLAALFAIAYRRPIRLFHLAFIPLVIGILFGFAVFSIFSTSLTPLTAVIGGILAGMGIDYCIQYLAHYELSRSLGNDSVAATEHTVGSLWPAMVAAWATSIVGFVAVSWSKVQALRDFAVLGSLGLTGAFIGAHFILPALLALRDRRGVAAANTISSPRIDLGPLLRWIRRRPRRFVAASVVALAFAGVIVVAKGSWLTLESDLSVMHPKPNAPLEAQQLIAQRMGGSPGSLIVYLQARSPDELVSLAHRVDERLRGDAAKRAGVVGSYGLPMLLPDPQRVAARRAEIRPEDADRVVADFRAAVAETGFAPAALEPYAEFLKHLLSDAKPPTIGDVLARPELAKTVLARDAIANRAAPTEAITLVFVDNPLEDAVLRGKVIEAIRGSLAGLDGATLTGLNVISHDVQATIQSDLPRVTLLAIAIVLLYLFAQLRTLHEPLLALVPMAFSLIMTLAVMHLLGKKLNMINLVTIPLLIGIDVDYAVFVVNAARLRRKSPKKMFEVQLASSCYSIIVCAGATILGFGSLHFTSVPAIQSLGDAVAIGVFTCLIATVFCLLPLVAPLIDDAPEEARLPVGEEAARC